jgi:hypothetical protein
MALVTLAGALGAVLLTWAIVYAALVGIGLAVRRWVDADVDTADQGRGADALSDAFWVGFAAVLLLLQLWHLVRPVDAVATALVLGGGLAAFAARRHAAAAQLREMWRVSRVTRALAALAVIWIALRALGPMTLYDSGMYHVPFVTWAKSYAIVPGLGNLHGRLAFNPSSLLFAAALDVGPWREGAAHVVNGLLVAAFSLHAVLASCRMRPGGAGFPRGLFELAVLPGVLAAALRQDVRSLSTDLPVFLLLLASVSRLFERLVQSGGDTSPPLLARGAGAWLGTTLAVLAAAVTVKLSALPFSAAGALLALALWLASRPSAGAAGWSWRPYVLPLALATVWLVRGAVLSGYPLYPSRVVALPVDWRVPAEQAAAEAAWVTMSARNLNTNELFASWEWLRPWVAGVVTRNDLFAYLLVPVGLLALVLLALAIRRRDVLRAWRRGAWLLAPLGVGLVVWWISAPHPRLAQALFWSATGAAAAVLAASTWGPQRRRELAIGVALITMLFVARSAASAALHPSGEGALRSAARAVLAARTESAWIAPMPAPDLLEYTLPTGIPLAVPRGDNSCWNGPALCTPHPVPTLSWRRTDDVAAGFRAGGAWEPTWWPNPWTPFLDYWRCLRAAPPGGPARDPEAACLERVSAAAEPNAGPR